MSHQPLNIIKFNLIIERIENEINFLKLKKDEETSIIQPRIEYLEEQLKFYKSEINKIDTDISVIDNTIKSISLTPEQIITSPKDLDKFIDNFNNQKPIKSWFSHSIEEKNNIIKKCFENNKDYIISQLTDKKSEFTYDKLLEKLIELIKNKKLKTQKEVAYDKSTDKITKINTDFIVIEFK